MLPVADAYVDNSDFYFYFLRVKSTSTGGRFGGLSSVRAVAFQIFTFSSNLSSRRFVGQSSRRSLIQISTNFISSHREAFLAIFHFMFR